LWGFAFALRLSGYFQFNLLDAFGTAQGTPHSLPRGLRQCYAVELLQRQTPPVAMAIVVPQCAGAFSANLQAQDSHLPFSVSTQHMGTQHTHPAVIDCPKRELSHDGRSNQTIDFDDRLGWDWKWSRHAYISL
jgi:hypothetical protein